MRLKYHLAAHLGYRSVAEMQRHLSAVEFSHWEKLSVIEPWGPYRLDILFGLLRWQTALPWCEKPPPVAGFLPRWGVFKPKTREEQIAEADAEWERSSGVFFDAME